MQLEKHVDLVEIVVGKKNQLCIWEYSFDFIISFNESCMWFYKFM